MSTQDRAPYLRPADPAKPGVLAFPLAGAGEIREVRFSARARAAHGSQGVTVTLALSEDGGATWRQLQRFTPDPEHTDNAMWFNHVMKEQHLKGGAAWLQVAVTGGGLEQVIANTLVEAPPAAPTDLRVTHVWREGEKERTFTRVIPAAGGASSYEVDAAEGVVNEEVRIEGIAQ